jgi:hypothetical protein
MKYNCNNAMHKNNSQKDELLTFVDAGAPSCSLSTVVGSKTSRMTFNFVQFQLKTDQPEQTWER